jgi:hypothetical protein
MQRKIMVKARTYRTNSLALILRRKDIEFDFFNLNCIHFTLPLSAVERAEIFITSNPEHYTIRVDFFKWATWNDFKLFTSEHNNGFDLLRALVACAFLPEKFYPLTINKTNYAN